MSSRKIILIIFIFLILFVVFMNTTLKKIQTVELDIVEVSQDHISDNLLSIVNEYLKHADEQFISNTTLDDIDIDVLFVDNINNEAALVTDGKITAVDYIELDKQTIYCNDYLVYIKNKPTLIINCDPILGDTVERAISLSYQKKFNDIEALDPENISYFEALDEDAEEHYYRYQMIESLKQSCFDNVSLDVFNYYYNKWAEHVGKGYLEIVDYDYYDGVKAYIDVKVKSKLHDEFSLESYINSYKNEYGIYDKASEYRVLGLLWCVVNEKMGYDIFVQDGIRNDKYKIMLQGVPLGSYADEKDRDDYNKKYKSYQYNLEELVQKYIANNKDIVPQELTLMCESYSKTIKLENNHYLYFDYIARDEDNETIIQDAMLAKIQPYKIKYYID